jgi:hypothetical protein
MKRILIVIATLCAAFAASEANAQVCLNSSGHVGYFIVCRGNLAISPVAESTTYMGAEDVKRLIIKGRKATTAGGIQGQNLQPGQCAWMDRPFGASEPAMVELYTNEYTGSGDSSFYLTPKSMDLAVACSMNSACVLRFCVFQQDKQVAGWPFQHASYSVPVEVFFPTGGLVYDPLGGVLSQ